MKAEEIKHVRTVRRVIRGVEKYLDGQQFRRRRNVPLDDVVLALVSKSVRVSDAVMRLVADGYSDEAFGLSRTLIETALNLRYITNRSSDYRVQRFIAFSARWKLELARRYIAQHPEQKLRLSTLVRQYSLLQKMARRFPKYGGSWVDTRRPRKGQLRGARRLASEVDRVREALPGDASTWRFDYRWIYFWTSEYVHATATSLGSHTTEDWREPFKIHAAPGYGGDTAGMATLNVATYLSRVLARALHVLGREFPQSLSQPLYRVIQAMNSTQP